MLPDSHGYLWIGTLDGLLRYNGTEVKNYNRSVLHTESSSISCIFEDSDNNIWIGTEGGLTVYVRENDEFVKVDTPESSDIKIDAKVGCIQQDREGLIWFSLKAKGIWSYDPESGTFRNYLYDPASGVPSPKINSFVIDGNGSFIVSVYFRGLKTAVPILVYYTRFLRLLQSLFTGFWGNLVDSASRCPVFFFGQSKFTNFLFHSDGN